MGLGREMRFILRLTGQKLKATGVAGSSTGGRSLKGGCLVFHSWRLCRMERKLRGLGRGGRVGGRGGGGLRLRLLGHETAGLQCWTSRERLCLFVHTTMAKAMTEKAAAMAEPAIMPARLVREVSGETGAAGVEEGDGDCDGDGDGEGELLASGVEAAGAEPPDMNIVWSGLTTQTPLRQEYPKGQQPLPQGGSSDVRAKVRIKLVGKAVTFMSLVAQVVGRMLWQVLPLAQHRAVVLAARQRQLNE